MTTRIAIGSVSSCAAAASLATNSPSATAGHLLVLEVSWGNGNGTSAQAPGAITGWTLNVGPTCAHGSGLCAGYAVYSKIAAGGVETPVFADPIGTNQLYAHGVITEWPSTCSFDSTASSGAVSTNSAAASTTGVTVPTTGTLSQSQGFALAGVGLIAGAGLSNGALAFSGGGWTTDITIQDTNADVGCLDGSKTLASNAAINAVFTWTSDSSMACYQAAIAMFADSAGGGGGGTAKQRRTLGGLGTRVGLRKAL